jgi:hypothetical protein
MATRKTTFEVVPLADIAPLLKNAEVLGAAEETGLHAVPRPAKILSVTYDLSLATTREMLFSSAGFQVSSVLTVGQAIERCAVEEFELVIVGHSIPLDQRKWLLKEVRGRCATPVLALRRAGEPPLTDADYTFDSTESPALLLETVINILRPKNRSAMNGRRME